MTSEEVLAAVCKLARKWFQGCGYRDADAALGSEELLITKQLKIALDYHAGNRNILCMMAPCVCPACIVREAEGLEGEPDGAVNYVCACKPDYTCPGCSFVALFEKGAVCDKCYVRYCNGALKDAAQREAEYVCGKHDTPKPQGVIDGNTGRSNREQVEPELVGNSGMPTPPGYGPEQVACIAPEGCDHLDCPCEKCRAAVRRRQQPTCSNSPGPCDPLCQCATCVDVACFQKEAKAAHRCTCDQCYVRDRRAAGQQAKCIKRSYEIYSDVCPCDACMSHHH